MSYVYRASCGFFSSVQRYANGIVIVVTIRKIITFIPGVVFNQYNFYPKVLKAIRATIEVSKIKDFAWMTSTEND